MNISTSALTLIESTVAFNDATDWQTKKYEEATKEQKRELLVAFYKVIVSIQNCVEAIEEFNDEQFKNQSFANNLKATVSDAKHKMGALNGIVDAIIRNGTY